VWGVGWAFGAISATRELMLGSRNAPDLFLTVWLTGWMLGGSWAVYVWLWNAVGKEIVVLQPAAASAPPSMKPKEHSWSGS
jgi:hypothetical protein